MGGRILTTVTNNAIAVRHVGPEDEAPIRCREAMELSRPGRDSSNQHSSPIDGREIGVGRTEGCCNAPLCVCEVSVAQLGRIVEPSRFRTGWEYVHRYPAWDMSRCR